MKSKYNALLKINTDILRASISLNKGIYKITCKNHTSLISNTLIQLQYIPSKPYRELSQKINLVIISDSVINTVDGEIILHCSQLAPKVLLIDDKAIYAYTIDHKSKAIFDRYIGGQIVMEQYTKNNTITINGYTNIAETINNKKYIYIKGMQFVISAFTSNVTEYYTKWSLDLQPHTII